MTDQSLIAQIATFLARCAADKPNDYFYDDGFTKSLLHSDAKRLAAALAREQEAQPAPKERNALLAGLASFDEWKAAQPAAQEPSEADAWLFECKKPGTFMVYASVDKDDTLHWPLDQWKSVVRTPLVKAAAQPPSTVRAEPQGLTDAQCDEFRRHPGTFNDMVRHIYRAGYWDTVMAEPAYETPESEQVGPDVAQEGANVDTSVAEANHEALKGHGS
jgi:hypothetical protein